MPNTSPQVQYTVQLNPAIAAQLPPDLLERLIEILQDPDAILQAAAVPLTQEEQQQNFASEGGVYESGWTPLAPYTIAEKHALGYGDKPMLVRTGKLEAAIGQTVEYSGSGSVTVGVSTSEVPYARDLNDGNAATNLPPRLLVGVTSDLESEVAQAISEYLTDSGIPQDAVIVTSNVV